MGTVKMGNTKKTQANANIISFGMEEIDKCLPAGGVRHGQLMMVSSVSGGGKTTFASQLASSIVAQERNCLVFELEQSAGTFYSNYLEAQVSKMGAKKRATMLEKLQRRLLIADGIHSGSSGTMTPLRVENSIRDAEVQHFGSPVEVVIIDHLGLVAGNPMQELFQICKKSNVLMIVIGTLPKGTPAGVYVGLPWSVGTT